MTHNPSRRADNNKSARLREDTAGRQEIKKMIFIRDEERLYLPTWGYNACRIMTALEEIVKRRGGKVKPSNTAIISNRNIDPDKTIKVTQPGHITFEYDGYVYEYNTDDNPFFDFRYGKTPIVDGKYSKDIYLTTDEERVFIQDSNLYFSNEETTDETVRVSALRLFEFLQKAPESKKYRNSHRVRVPNVYDGKSHYETVYEKERLEKIWEDESR